jgi:hypothetical protein
MVALRSCVIALVVVLGACDVGEVPGGGTDAGTGTDAGDISAKQKSTFGTVITPLVTANTAAGPRCTRCHAAGQQPILSSYDSLGATYKMGPGANNILVKKGNHEGITDFFNATEQTQVANWIDGK